MENKIRERFWTKVAITHPEKCWEWQAGKRSDGYGHFNVNYRNLAAHRFSFYLMYGEEPEVVRHKCDNPKCVNPFHLEAGTQKQNCRDTVERGRHPNASKTHCKKGHEFTEENTYVHPTKGSRECYICRKENKKQLKLNKKNIVDL